MRTRRSPAPAEPAARAAYRTEIDRRLNMGFDNVTGHRGNRQTTSTMKPTLIVHGGCGTPPPGEEPERLAACERAADAGWEVLRAGGGALDAVEAAVRRLEDEPLLNAGTGSYLQADGVARMDASVMTGDGRAGAVAQVPGLKNPIRLARYLLDQDAHVMLAGPEALQLALASGARAGRRGDAREDRLLAGAAHRRLPVSRLRPDGRRLEERERAPGNGRVRGPRRAREARGGHVDGGHGPVLSGARGRHADTRRRNLLHGQGRGLADGSRRTHHGAALGQAPRRSRRRTAEASPRRPAP